MSKLYITTSIPYVNAAPHVGFLLELVQADAIARFGRLIGRDVHFQTGTDENATKNALAAAALNLPTAELVERNSECFRRLLGAFDISADGFIRTTEPRHARGVHALWRRLRPGDVYRGTYRGLYCVGCEDFLSPRDLVDGRCPDHVDPPVQTCEDNYFFRLSAYQEQLERLLSEGRIRVVPPARLNEVLSFVRRGLEDISISRSTERARGWGIRVPGDDAHVVYVWIDALVNYISGLGFGSDDRWGQWWGDDVTKLHVIGKNVWKFHAIYWPALLLSAGLPLPDAIAVHGFVTAEGRKIGKSLGNAVDPFELAGQVGSDAVRYYLLRSIPPFDDGDVSQARLREVYNADLANGLGNLVARVTTLSRKAGYQPTGLPGATRGPGAAGQPCTSGTVRPSPGASDGQSAVLDAPDGYTAAMEGFRFDQAVASLWRIVDRLNVEVERVRPWELLKAPDPAPLHAHLRRWTLELARLAHWLSPLLPRTAQRIRERLSGEDPDQTPLFPRLP